MLGLMIELVAARGDMSIASAVTAFKKQKAEFFNDAAAVLAQVKLSRILELRARRNEETPLGEAYEDILKSYRSGEKLSESFGPYLSDSERLAISGWDTTKSDEELAEGFKMVGQIATAFVKIKGAMAKSGWQAVGSISVALFLLYMMKSQVYPSLEKLFPVAKWMIGARFTYYVINAMFGNLFLSAIVLLSIGGLYWWSLANWNSALRRRLDHKALYSWYRSYRSLQILLALSLHLQAKRGIPTALSMIMENASPWETWYLQEMEVRNVQGEKGGAVFDVGLFDAGLMERIILLSEAGSSEEALETIAFTSQAELLDKFRSRIELAGEGVKKTALFVGVVPLAMFFYTIGDFIFATVTGGGKPY